jgi:predicted nucleic-acid-binding Zn-ribbon protein
MKLTHRCPKCACPKLYVVPRVRQPHADRGASIQPLRVTCVPLPVDQVPGASGGNTLRVEIGTFEAWICSACGLTEWYAMNAVEALEHLAKLDNDVRVVEDIPATPYR